MTTRSEVCDDGNQKDGDGCSADCKTKDAGCTCTPGQLSICPVVKCGNGVVEGNEGCDDGNTASNDGAQFNTGDYGGCAPSCIFALHCSDGIKNGPEDCDHGPDNGLDGACSTACKNILYLPP